MKILKNKKFILIVPIAIIFSSNIQSMERQSLQEYSALVAPQSKESEAIRTIFSKICRIGESQEEINLYNATKKVFIENRILKSMRSSQPKELEYDCRLYALAQAVGFKSKCVKTGQRSIAHIDLFKYFEQTSKSEKMIL